MAVSKSLRYAILTRDGETCRKCGRTPPDVKLHVDHVIPVALGGADDPSNLQTLCADCNTGKAALPADAPKVAQVSEDAERWSRAMELVAQGRAINRMEARERHRQFIDKWNSWTYPYKGERHTIDIPGSWKPTVDQFLDAGLDMEDLHELIDVAIGTRGVKDEWSYFCGCCWTRIREAQAQAAAILRLQEASNA